jgi:serine/threonine protein kinase
LLVISRQKIYEMEFRDYTGVALQSAHQVESVQRALSSRFHSIELLRSDGDVSFYTGREVESGGGVKLRALSDVASRNPRLVDSFYRKAKTGARLKGPHFVSTSEATELGGIHFCVIEHPPLCTSLRDLLERSGWLAATEAVEIADQVASALSLAHQAGIEHLALTPEHIWIEEDGWVLIDDFGFEAGDHTLFANTGSPDPRYASPEQMAGGAGDSLSDLYSLGAILYEMLTDRSPFDCAIFDEAQGKPAPNMIPPPNMVKMDVPEVLSHAVMCLLEQDPSRRVSVIEFQRLMSRA